MTIKVTIITPVLNSINTIQDCITSIAKQDYDNIEHIIIDGCSTDGTLAFLSSKGFNFISEPDTGIYNAINKGITKATGEIIHILNADDYYAHDKVVSQVVHTMLKEKALLCHGYVSQIDAKGNVIKRVGKNINKKELLHKMRVAHPSVFIMKSVYDNLGVFNQSFRIAGDHEFLLRIWSSTSITFMPETLVKMRLGGISNSQVELSYRESMAASIIHGLSPLKALSRYYLELFKAKLLCLLNQ